MKKYYTRPCNFYYGAISKKLIKNKTALPLCGDKNLSFDKLEIFTKNKNKISTKIISIKNIKNQKLILKKKIKSDIKKITASKKYFKEPYIMGILNMTPDSFSDGGRYNQTKKAFNRIKTMIKSGANIIDIGGESTRPGSIIIKPKNEWKRIEATVKIFKKKFPNTLLSVDTRKSEVMKKSIKYNTDIINDVSSFNYDSNSINIVKNQNIWKVIHHMQVNPQNMQNNPKYQNVLLDIYDFFEMKIKELQREKNAKKIIIDPGIGFGKNLKHNLMLLNKISLFHSLGFPILIGTSRKKFIGQISGKFDSKERIGGTLSSVIFTLLQGVKIFRVHNVEEIKQGLLVYKKILNQ
jgi:dihydropteroate synthase